MQIPHSKSEARPSRLLIKDLIHSRGPFINKRVEISATHLNQGSRNNPIYYVRSQQYRILFQGLSRRYLDLDEIKSSRIAWMGFCFYKCPANIVTEQMLNLVLVKICASHALIDIPN
ncbi:unnamed protein product [Cercopithifilaria johnstoni]|uniref:Uncharacterized protein n=1 Tax=Cercopithifilaria johnstoni TaxID=2874296 RepID=A0A8J2Q9B9_9BILA|nr:unnamed protein product [Cercopithifilaria johnstoni]